MSLVPSYPPTYLPMTGMTDKQTTDNIKIYENEKQYTCETLNKKKNNAYEKSILGNIYYEYDRYTHNQKQSDENITTNSEVK